MEYELGDVPLTGRTIQTSRIAIHVTAPASHVSYRSVLHVFLFFFVAFVSSSAISIFSRMKIAFLCDSIGNDDYGSADATSGPLPG